jgi:hypothetical protein
VDDDLRTSALFTDPMIMIRPILPAAVGDTAP